MRTSQWRPRREVKENFRSSRGLQLSMELVWIESTRFRKIVKRMHFKQLIEESIHMKMSKSSKNQWEEKFNHLLSHLLLQKNQPISCLFQIASTRTQQPIPKNTHKLVSNTLNNFQKPSFATLELSSKPYIEKKLKKYFPNHGLIPISNRSNSPPSIFSDILTPKKYLHILNTISKHTPLHPAIISTFFNQLHQGQGSQIQTHVLKAFVDMLPNQHEIRLIQNRLDEVGDMSRVINEVERVLVMAIGCGVIEKARLMLLVI